MLQAAIAPATHLHVNGDSDQASNATSNKKDVLEANI